jgi:hypothetical protein
MKLSKKMKNEAANEQVREDNRLFPPIIYKGMGVTLFMGFLVYLVSRNMAGLAAALSLSATMLYTILNNDA